MLMATERLARLYVGWRPASQAQVQSLQISQSQLQNLKPSQHASHSLQAEVLCAIAEEHAAGDLCRQTSSMSYARQPCHADHACPRIPASSHHSCKLCSGCLPKLHHRTSFVLQHVRTLLFPAMLTEQCLQTAKWIISRAEAVDAATGSLARCGELVQAGKQLGLGAQLQELEQCIAELQAVTGDRLPSGAEQHLRFSVQRVNGLRVASRMLPSSCWICWSHPVMTKVDDV